VPIDINAKKPYTKKENKIMAVRFWLEEIQFSDTTRIKLSKNDIIVLVGPNNSGKSATLKETLGLIKASHYEGKVLKSLILEREGTEVDFFSLVESNSFVDNTRNEPFYKGFGFSFFKSVAKDNWGNFKNGIESIFPIFGNLLTTEQRLLAANPANNI
jgi:energy-coupling factor transporter ATP-binding protein EcfA2